MATIAEKTLDANGNVAVRITARSDSNLSEHTVDGNGAPALRVATTNIKNLNEHTVDENGAPALRVICEDGSVGGGATTDEWHPNPNWWDIRKILDEDTRDYAGKVGVILYNFNDVSDFKLSSSGMTAVATSDGAFYTYADNGENITHNWDTSKDKDDGRGFKTRWVIYYYTTNTTGDTFDRAATKFGWAYNYIAYLVLRINCSNGSSFCQHQRFLEAISNEGYSINGTNFSYFCSSCYVLTKLPDVLDTSNGTNFSYFCGSCYVLTKLPEITMAANATNYTSKYSAPFVSSTWIVELPLTLPSNSNFWLDNSTRISIESFRYMADHAPDVTATPRTLTVGSANITRINAEDPTIITALNAKGWTVA